MSRIHSRVGALAAVTSLTLAQAGCAVDHADDDGAKPNDAVTQSDQGAYDAETLFRGIYFGTGSAASLMPGLQEAEKNAPISVRAESAVAELRNAAAAYAKEGAAQTSAELQRLANEIESSGVDTITRKGGSAQQIAAVQNAMIDAIRGSDPSFIERWAADMRSGQQPIVERALTRGATQLLHFRNASNPTSGFGSSNGGSRAQPQSDGSGAGFGAMSDSGSFVFQQDFALTINYVGVIAVVMVAVVAVTVLAAVPTSGLAGLRRDQLVNRLTMALKRP